MQKVLPQGRVRVRGERRILPALRQPLRHRRRDAQARAADRGRGRACGFANAQRRPHPRPRGAVHLQRPGRCGPVGIASFPFFFSPLTPQLEENYDDTIYSYSDCFSQPNTVPPLFSF
ncbi:hypothetical protein VTN02DRAFT_717 [Thermoascus thermophilus]